MIIGIPKEIKEDEHRVSLTPFGAEELVKSGNSVLIQSSAGVSSGFSDETYIKSGANILKTSEEIYSKSDMIVKVKEPIDHEISLIKKDQIIFTFFHFAASKELTNGMIENESIAIAYETVQKDSGELPLLIPMSEVAGRMAVQNGAKCLEENMGGKGKLLSGVPGVEPATVTILGGGVVGTNAAKLASGMGAKVNILDINPERLRYLDDIMPSNVCTLYSNRHNISDLLPKTDLLIGAVLVVGAKAPNLVTKEMLQYMDKKSVIVDVAVDQGGCVETCKPTTHKNPTYEVSGITHYCVANMPGAVPYTSTLALSNSTFKYIYKLANTRLENNLSNISELRSGLNIYKGNVTHAAVAESFSIPYSPLDTLL